MTPIATCGSCGGTLLAGDRTCGTCGTPVQNCRGCGETLTPNDRFCPRCGISAAPAAANAAPAYSPWTQVLARLQSATAGEFEIIRELGRGGMAAVYLAQETALNRSVAIKVMAPGVMMGEGMIDRFRQEAVTVANLSHPNIITIHAVRQFEDLHFFVMKFVDGQPLDAVLQAAGMLPVPIVRSILFQVGTGLAYAHRRGVIHRDIKPANILLDSDGNAVVTDFGIAKVAETPGYTKTGTMVGTPAYMSPEQCVAEPLTWSSDQYSLGIVAYELITGAPPFSGSSFAIMQGHLERQPADPTIACPACPPDLAAAVLRMLAKSPDERFPAMGAALQALGARPLQEDDPLRAKLERLVVPAGGAGRVGVPRIPVSPRPAPRVATPEATTPMPARPVPVKAAAVEIVGAPDEIETGEHFTVSARVSGPDGTPISGRRVAWATAPASVAAIGADGDVSARAAGTATITATVDGISGSRPVLVRPPRVATLALSAPRSALAVGEQVDLTATALDRHGRSLTPALAWASSNPAILSVSDRGAAVARAPGVARIIVSAAEQEAQVEIEVRPAPVARIQLSKPPKSMTAGTRAVLIATPLDGAGRALEGRMVEWSSSDRAVARVDGGTVEAVAPGHVTITARAEDVSASASMTVVPVPLAAISIGGLPAEPLEIGADAQLHANLADASGARLERTVEWRSSKTRVAVVSDAGVVTAVGPGKTDVTARADGVKASARVEVRAPAPAASTPAAVASAPDALPAATLRRVPRLWVAVPVVIALLTAAWLVLRSPRPERPVAAGIQHVGSDSITGTVAPPVPAGADTHTAQPRAPNGTAPEPPAARPARSVRMAPARLALSSGDTARVSADVLNERGQPVSGQTVQWSTSRASVATVDRTGLVRAVAPGIAIVSAATSAGERGRVTITVAAVPRPVPETTVATPPPPVPTPPRADPAATFAARDAAVRSAAGECLAALRSVDAARMEQLYAPVGLQDAKNAEKLLTLMRRKEWAFAATGSGAVTPQGSETEGHGEFAAQLTWKNSFGKKRELGVTLRVDVRAAGGNWQSAGCRLQGTPDL